MLYTQKLFICNITSWLSRRTRHIINVYCSTLTNGNLPKQQKENIDIREMEELIEIKTELPKMKKKNKAMEYIEKSISCDEEILDIIKKVNPDTSDIIQLLTDKNILLEKAQITKLLLIDKDTAAKYVSLIKNDLLKNTCYIAELNPGFGILTRELLKAGVPLIHLYENNLKLHDILKIICTKYPGKLKLIFNKYYTLFGNKKTFYIKNDIKKYQDNFQEIKSKNWEDETCMQIIGACDDINIFSFIIHNTIFRIGFMFYGRPVFYIAVSPSVWHNYNICNNLLTYTYTKVMFKLMFNFELLGTLNRKAFIPWPQKKQYKRNTSNLLAKQNYEQLYVIKLEPKADIYTQLSPKDWITFSYFVRHFMHTRRTRVIPALEKWVPDCGIKLIAKDYTIYTQFGDLTPTQILELFKEFKSWSDYKYSHFIDSMNNSVGAHNEFEFLK
ncbi:Dimethyladenosine transferase 2, mitochondrial [Trachymyrmex septentrionalis]|uniref:Dimethyladenosine transferase 2, mitochondrial n=2 Tax=Trachymyrmex septentrionalis TaxID=34720 RepID=A0A195FTI7_9HYME|nr:PREDICTED: dimethyladenosine transferase 2, mitochondrial isoform X2 [Trachymyrmex septentrionalis]KYN43204.1 Dimethyladenosine transferase 2, mitochondrial [Trachymyrmex septentrionalis]